MNRKIMVVVLFAIAITVVGVLVVDAQGPRPATRSPRANVGTGFSYQGLLKNGGTPVNGSCNLQFGLWDDSTAGTQLGVTQTVTVTVMSGLFTNVLNSANEFGANAINGDARWLTMAVRCPSGGGGYIALDSRQALTPSPMALTLPGMYTQQNATSPNVIGGYSGNFISETVYAGTISGGGRNGLENKVWANYATIGGGSDNLAGSIYATVGGGYSNTASGFRATVGGGGYNTASNNYGSVGGGYYNLASGDWATISGGGSNTAAGYGTVSGGSNNIAAGTGSTIGGGGTNGTSTSGNKAYGLSSTIDGGLGNYISVDSDYGVIGGGQQNSITATAGSNLKFATIGGGYNNKVALGGGTVSGGNSNTASNFDAVVGGGLGNVASGGGATVPGGNYNLAQGWYSFATGYHANALHQGAFVWADSAGVDLNSTVNDQFLIRASGGITLYTNMTGTSGVSVYPGSGSWNVLSNKNIKANFVQVDSQDILAQVSQLPITTWNYTTQDTTIRHIGPMAQDFYAAFGLGENDTTISTVDADGIALAAIQGLAQVVKDKDAKISNLESQISNLEARLTVIEQSTQVNNAQTHSESTNNLALIVLGGFLGILIAQKPWKRGER